MALKNVDGSTRPIARDIISQFFSTCTWCAFLPSLSLFHVFCCIFRIHRARSDALNWAFHWARPKMELYAWNWRINIEVHSIRLADFFSLCQHMSNCEKLEAEDKKYWQFLTFSWNLTFNNNVNIDLSFLCNCESYKRIFCVYIKLLQHNDKKSNFWFNRKYHSGLGKSDVSSGSPLRLTSRTTFIY